MGKIADALDKAASENRRAKEPRAKRHTPPPVSEGDPFTNKMIDSLRLQPPDERASVPEQALYCQPLDELIVTCYPNGDHDFIFAAEQYKMLRSQLLFPADRASPRTIMVTSAIPGEGKSVVASNLAISIALGKQEFVLLIECDLRRPTMAKLFGLPHSVRGLSDYLLGEEELSNLLCKTSIDRLTLLPGGSLAQNPYELISSRRMIDLLEEVKTRYGDRYIVLDSTPTQVAAETGVLSRFIDGIVLVVRYGKSPRKVIQTAVEKVGKDKFLGVVFNGFEGKFTNSYYYKYYGGAETQKFRWLRRK